MGVTKAVPAAAVLALLLLFAGTGCSSSSPVSNRRLIEHQAFVDFSGLAPAEQVSAVKVSCALPRSWNPTELKKTPLYAHQQWKSPSGRTGVGVVHIRLPIPLSEGMLLWLAKREYAKANNDGKVIGEWKDEVGRSWFEAENNKYHVRGYALVRGFNAWIIYFGSKTGYPPDMAELSLAARCVETFIPDPKRPMRAPRVDEDGTDAKTAAAD
jgi:hypothetical protein